MGRLGIKSFVLAKGACRDAQANGIEPLSVAHAVWPAASQLATNPVPRRIIHSLVYLDCACIRCDAMRCDAARTHPTCVPFHARGCWGGSGLLVRSLGAMTCARASACAFPSTQHSSSLHPPPCCGLLFHCDIGCKAQFEAWANHRRTSPELAVRSQRMDSQISRPRARLLIGPRSKLGYSTRGARRPVHGLQHRHPSPCPAALDRAKPS
jgi:hypothetical protein